MRRAYLREAVASLIAARLAVRFIPPARVFAWANRPPRRIDRFAVDEIPRVAWAIETIEARRWMQAPILPRSLAVHSMLRRRGIASRLCLGCSRERGTLALHAWVEVGREIVFGDRHAPQSKPLADFGGSPG